MIAWKYVGLEKMKFNLSGGKGSNGQHGGNGAISDKSLHMFTPIYKDGGDGGKGGNAGLGGKHGESFIYETNEKKP